MLKTRVDQLDVREEMLAVAVKELASELRLIDVDDLVGYIREQRFGNIAQLVSSSAELYYRPGTVAFVNSGESMLAWGKDPRVSLDMQFQSCGVVVFFRLHLEDTAAGVEINYMSVDGDAGCAGECDGTDRLRRAIQVARYAG
jgi:hypothetical protein